MSETSQVEEVQSQRCKSTKNVLSVVKRQKVYVLSKQNNLICLALITHVHVQGILGMKFRLTIFLVFKCFLQYSGFPLLI